MASTELTDDSFAQALRDRDTVAIDFWAPWCGPCRIFEPMFERVAERRSGILFARVGADINPGLAGRFGIRAIPTLVGLREGNLLFSRPGLPTEHGIERVLEKTAGPAGRTVVHALR